MSRVVEERGFTLIEALVTFVVMVGVFFALHAIFEAGVRAVSVGEDETEANARARLAMERMEGEIRAANPYGAERRHLFFLYETPTEARLPTPDRITFGNDRDGKCGLSKTTGEACGTEANPRELVSYYVNDSGTLIRRNNNRYTGLTNGVTELRFAYFGQNGDAAKSEAEVKRVDILLTVEVGGAEQNLKSSVALRSRV